jgi:deoxycytidylate deaminase
MYELPAIKQARKVDDIRCRHGAALYHKHKLVAVAHNMRVAGMRTIHAEEAVLRKIPKGARGYDLLLVVVRLDRFGNIYDSKPCKRCTKRIIAARIGRVLYSTP